MQRNDQAARRSKVLKTHRTLKLPHDAPTPESNTGSRPCSQVTKKGPHDTTRVPLVFFYVRQYTQYTPLGGALYYFDLHSFPQTLSGLSDHLPFPTKSKAHQNRRLKTCECFFYVYNTVMSMPKTGMQFNTFNFCFIQDHKL